MKVISPLTGVCALHFSPDEALSKTGVLNRKINEFIGPTYNFSVHPQPIMIQQQSFGAAIEQAFQGGEITIGEQTYAINQLIYMPPGLAVTARDTDIAEMVVTEIAATLDANFGLSISKSIRAKYYMSDIIVDFEAGVEKQISAFARIKALLEREIPRPDAPFDLKRLAFGAPEKAFTNVVTSLEAIANQDFTIERRANEPHSLNRYYARAPIRTKDHERILALFEKAFQE
jgi:hypothetical protein